MQFSLNDDFNADTLKKQWKFLGEYDTTRFHLKDGALVMDAKGNAIGNSAPLLCIPSHHSYTAEVEIMMEGDAIAGLVMFYNNVSHPGIMANKGNVLANLRGWQFVTEKNVVNSHVFLRLKKLGNTVDQFYSTDGVSWKKIENSLDVSGMNHNALSILPAHLPSIK